MFAWSAAAFLACGLCFSAELPGDPPPTHTPEALLSPPLEGVEDHPGLVTWDTWTHFCFWRKDQNWVNLSPGSPLPPVLWEGNTHPEMSGPSRFFWVESVIRFLGGRAKSARCGPGAPPAAVTGPLPWLTGGKCRWWQPLGQGKAPRKVPSGQWTLGSAYASRWVRPLRLCHPEKWEDAHSGICCFVTMAKGSFLQSALPCMPWEKGCPAGRDVGLQSSSSSNVADIRMDATRREVQRPGRTKCGPEQGSSPDPGSSRGDGPWPLTSPPAGVGIS